MCYPRIEYNQSPECLQIARIRYWHLRELITNSFDVMRADQCPVSSSQLQSSAVASCEGLNGTGTEAGCHLEGVPVADDHEALLRKSVSQG